MSTIRLLSGGAAQGLVSHLQEDFRTETGCAVDALYDAVGAIKDRFMDGDAADLIILTDAIITQMAEEGHVVPACWAWSRPELPCAKATKTWT